MLKIKEAREIFSLLQFPKALQSDICCYAFLAMAGISKESDWSEATNKWIRIHDIIEFT
jgi:hypothetical protein